MTGLDGTIDLGTRILGLVLECDGTADQTGFQFSAVRRLWEFSGKWEWRTDTFGSLNTA